jgi:hypothetical protein
LQGTFEKIHFQRLFHQHPLQLVDFLAQRGFTRVPSGRLLTGVKGFKLISPLVKKASMQTKFLRQCHDVLASFQSFDSHSTKFFRIPPHSSLSHLQFLSCKVCLIRVSQVKGSVHGFPLPRSPAVRSQVFVDVCVPATR